MVALELRALKPKSSLLPLRWYTGLGKAKSCLSSFNHLHWSLPQKHEARTAGIVLVCNSNPPSNVNALFHLSQFFIVEDYGQCPLPDWL